MPKDPPNGMSDRNGSGRKRLMRRAEAAVGATLRAGAALYDRQRDLPRLIRVDVRPAECETDVEAIVQRLARALRAERNRARSGHWTYDLNRHIALRQAYLAESDRLAALRRDRN